MLEIVRFRLMLASLYDQEEFSDVTIRFYNFHENGRLLKEHEINCHRVIISQASKYFKAMCGSTTNSADQRQEFIDLDDDDECDGRLTQGIIRHMYNFSYAEIQELCTVWEPQAHMYLYIAARKYFLPKLESEALAALYASIEKQ